MQKRKKNEAEKGKAKAFPVFLKTKEKGGGQKILF
jgi:hypothetical protein